MSVERSTSVPANAPLSTQSSPGLRSSPLSLSPSTSGGETLQSPSDSRGFSSPSPPSAAWSSSIRAWPSASLHRLCRRSNCNRCLHHYAEGSCPDDPCLHRCALGSVGRLPIETRLSNWNSPAQLFRSSLEATPDSPTLWFNLGFTLREEGNLPRAAEAYQSAIRLNPKYQRAYSSLGETYARMGRAGHNAGSAYRRALVLNPNDAGTSLNLAVTLHQAGRDQEAEREFRHTIALSPNDAAAYTDLGVLLYKQGKVDEAESMFIDAIAHNPADPTPYSNLALLYQQSGHPALALTLYQKILALRPNDPDALANLRRLQKAP